MSWREQRHGGFVFLWRRGWPLVAELLAEGELRASDVAVVWALAARQHSAAGTSRASVQSIAKETGSSPATVSHALRRLARARLVARVGNPRSRPPLYSINPCLIANGSRKQQAYAGKYFAAAWADMPEPTPATEAAVKARQAPAHHAA